MCEKLLILNDEYGGKNRTDERNEKRLMASTEFSLRAPYGKINETFKRIATLCGTCNEREVLDDPTGNRRIIVIEATGKFDYLQYNMIDKYQLMAEALVLFRQGARPELTDFEIEGLEMLTDGKHSKVSFEAEMVMQYCKPPIDCIENDFMTTTRIKNSLELFSKEKVNLNKLGSQLRKMGYKRIKESGVYGYRICKKELENSTGN